MRAMPTSALLLWSLALPFAGSVVVALLPAHARRAAAVISGIVATALTALAVLFYGRVVVEHLLRTEVRWLPDLGLSIIVRLDGLSWLFMAMISGIGALVVLYAHYYMAP
jgi:multicomponent K+:H+ antiporter subunit A